MGPHSHRCLSCFKPATADVCPHCGEREMLARHDEVARVTLYWEEFRTLARWASLYVAGDGEEKERLRLRRILRRLAFFRPQNAHQIDVACSLSPSPWLIIGRDGRAWRREE